MKHTYTLWKRIKHEFIWLLVGLILGAAMVGTVVWQINRHDSKSHTPVAQTVKKDQETLTIKSLTKEKQVVLVNLGMSEVFNEEKSSQLFGKNIVGTNRKKFMQATFDAKLGINGKEVDITSNGKDSYVIKVPKFIFIGYNNPNFKLLDEHNGVFSSFTSDISETDMINKVLNDKSKQKYVEKYDDLLKKATKEFYRELAHSIDPDAKLSFKFSNK